MNEKITLCVYTNCTKFNSKDINLISDTIKSFDDTFCIKDFVEKIIIFIDSNPCVENFLPYRKKILEFISQFHFAHPEVISTSSLSDGYLQSLYLSPTRYVFQLEHDWVFIGENVNHDINEIISMMSSNQVYYLRFNKRKNIPAVWDRYLREVAILNSNIKVSEVPNLSNNPHLIDKSHYMVNGFHTYIKVKNFSHGIEEELNKKEIKGFVYGGFEHPPTIFHLDGKKLYSSVKNPHQKK